MSYTASGAAVANVTTICGELRELFEEMWAPSKRNAIPPYEMLSAVWGLLPSFSAGLQQDAHEFIRLLLDRLRRELDAAMRSHGGHLEKRGGEIRPRTGGKSTGGRLFIDVDLRPIKRDFWPQKALQKANFYEAFERSQVPQKLNDITSIVDTIDSEMCCFMN